MAREASAARWLALGLALVVALGTAGCSGGSPQPAPAPTPTVRPARTGQERGAERPSRASASSRSRRVQGESVPGLLVEPDEGRTAIERAINGAQQSVDLVIYLLSDRQTIAALKAAQARGVRVRVMLEEHPYGGGPGNGAVAQDLQAAGVTTAWSNPAFRLTHQKTLVLDGSTAWVMTLNLTASAFTRNREFAVRVTDPAAVAEIEQVFEADWDRQAVHPGQPSLVWSPDNSRAKTLDVIRGAKRTLEIYNEEMQDAETEQALAQAAQRQVAVRVLMTGGGGGNDPNEPGRQRISQAGAQVRLIATPYIHAKMILADEGASGAGAFVGSENISTASLDQNRELGVLVSDATYLHRLHDVFEHDWSEAH
ncbi:MAG TPA: phospholipase D-like domain-containing protein [Chloroflexota bacterium]|nr:phospholipase D-like domain-containing protein [Chloroflexota bacterium]